MNSRIGALLLVLLAGIGLAAGPARADEPSLDVKTVGNISYVSGGVGVSERQALDQVKSQYNLHLLFAYSKSGAFLAGVRVRIAKASGAEVLDAVSAGPYFYARLPAGHYRVSADNAGKVQTKSVTVPANGRVSENFYWTGPQEQEGVAP
jgi:hypothetical protein